MICEVCGSVQESEEMTVQDNHLHVCPDCIKDRQAPEMSEASAVEK